MRKMSPESQTEKSGVGVWGSDGEGSWGWGGEEGWLVAASAGTWTPSVAFCLPWLLFLAHLLQIHLSSSQTGLSRFSVFKVLGRVCAHSSSGN